MQGTGQLRTLAKLACALLVVSFSASAVAADKSFVLDLTVVQMVNGQTEPVQGASVFITHNRLGPELRFSDYKLETDGSGHARTTITLSGWGEGWLYWPVLDIEVTKGDLHGKDSVKVAGTMHWKGNEFPASVAHTIVLNKGPSGAPESTSTLTIKVFSQGENKEPVAGAKVDVYIYNGFVTHTYSGQSDASGTATVVAPLDNAFELHVTKTGFKEGKKSIFTKNEYRKELSAEVILEKEEGSEVTITVTDEENSNKPIVDATVVLTGTNNSGFYKGTTDGSGRVVFYIKEIGQFAVEVSQDYYEQLSGELRVLSNEKQSFPFSLKAKPKKEEGKDVVEVTVLKKDAGDQSASALEGASVTVGRSGSTTDASGIANVSGSFDFKEDVTAAKAGYKSQTKQVSIVKLARYSGGTGKVSFILEPDVSEDNPINITVEVQDMGGNKIDGADVEFISASGISLRRMGTRNGRVDFRSGDAPDVPIAEQRKGISVNVSKKPEYKDVSNRSVPANLLRPSLEGGIYVVQLDRDWTELDKALGALEAKVAALKTEAADAEDKARRAETLLAKFPAAKARVEEMLNELKQAEAAFKPEQWKQRCDEAERLAKEITEIQKDAAKKEEEIKKGLDEAIALSATCDSKAQADTIKTRYREALKAAGEISKLTKKVSEPHQKLVQIAEAMKQGGPLKKQVEEALMKIEAEVEAAEKDSAISRSAFIDAAAGAANIPSKRAALISELETITTKFDLAKNAALVPAELKTRFDGLARRINSINPPKDVSIERLDQVMKPVLAQLDQAYMQARGTANAFDKAVCELKPMDAEVEEINSRVSGATIELSAAADVSAKADECIAKASQSPTPTADEVIVPDVTGLTDPSKMTAAANQAGMKPSLVASTEPPAANGGGVVVRQNPAAGSKAQRGDSLTIFLSQRKVTAATPTPLPSPVASPSAKMGDEATVPSIPAGVTVAEAKATLTAAGLTVGFNAQGGKPSTQDLEFKTTGSQDPPGGSKAKRGTTVTVSIYQKYETAVSPTPTPEPTPPTAALGTMPDLVGLTLDQAVSRLSGKMRIGSDEAGTRKPPTPEDAYRIYYQSPPAGTKLDPDVETVVSVKRYGSAQVIEESTPQPSAGGVSDDFVGVWTGVWGEITIMHQEGGYTLLSKDAKGAKSYKLRAEGGKLFYEYDDPAYDGKLRIKVTFSVAGDNLEMTLVFVAIGPIDPRSGPLPPPQTIPFRRRR